MLYRVFWTFNVKRCRIHDIKKKRNIQQRFASNIYNWREDGANGPGTSIILQIEIKKLHWQSGNWLLQTRKPFVSLTRRILQTTYDLMVLLHFVNITTLSIYSGVSSKQDPAYIFHLQIT